MSTPSQTESAYVQTFVRSKFFVHSSCVQKSSCPDFRAFKIAYVQTLVRSKGKFVRSKIDNLCVHVQAIVRSRDLLFRLSCVPNQKLPAAKLIFCAFVSRLSCFQKTLCRALSAFKIAYVRIFECSEPKFARSKSYTVIKNYYFCTLSVLSLRCPYTEFYEWRPL